MIHNEIAKKNRRKLFKIQRKRQCKLQSYKAPWNQVEMSKMELRHTMTDSENAHGAKDSEPVKQHHVLMTFSFSSDTHITLSITHSINISYFPCTRFFAIFNIFASWCSDVICHKCKKGFLKECEKNLSQLLSHIGSLLSAKADLIIS